MAETKPSADELLRQYQAGRRHIRWRKLRPISGNVVSTREADLVHMYGYSVGPYGPWFGYPKGSLQDAPCSHCGQTGLYQNEQWRHHCPGIFEGVPCSLLEDHLCKGEPSMSNAPIWPAGYYEEVK